MELIYSFLFDKSPAAVRARRLASVLFFAGLLIALGFILPWGDILGVLGRSNLPLIGIAFLLSIPTQYLEAFSYKVIADQQGIHLSAIRLMAINLTIRFYEIFIPGTLVGSSLRLYRYAKASNKPSESFVALAFYKIFNIFLVLLLCSSFLFFSDASTIMGNYTQIGLLLVATSAILLLLPRLSQVALGHIKLPDEAASYRRVKFLIKLYAFKIISAFAELSKMKLRFLVLIVLLGLATQVIQLAAYFLFARGVGISLSLFQLGMIRALILLAANLPFNFSPGIGLREISLVALLVAMGIELEYAVAMSLVAFARVLFYGLVGGVIEGIQFLKK